jgi:hypothetical protein
MVKYRFIAKMTTKHRELKSIPLKYWDFSGVKDSEGKPIVLKQEELSGQKKAFTA